MPNRQRAMGTALLLFHLFLPASYTVPQVSCSQLEGQGYQDGAGVRLSCLSSGGYPSYELRWVWANGSQFTGQASATTRRQVADGTFWLQSVLEVDLSWGPHLRCVLSNLRLNRTSSGQTSCPAHPHRPAHNPFSGIHVHSRTGLTLFAGLVLFLVLLICLRVLWLELNLRNKGPASPDRGGRADHTHEEQGW